MADNDKQATLDRLLQDLKSNESARCLKALEELNLLNFSSTAIVRELERLAIHHPDEFLQNSALQSLGTIVHQHVRRKVNTLGRGDRLLLLKQIERWTEENLLPSNIADVIASRYDFDILPPGPEPEPARKKENDTPLGSPPPQPAMPVGPRPSLMQTLLSEASVKIYLYLGAFFVIAAALILAALVEAARLPILMVATLAFGGTALALHRRLPQPSFALFIVFSFLLLIDANVLEETLSLREPALSIYWTIVFLAMAVIWGLSVWFYESKFFSAVAFVSLSLAFYRTGEIFRTEVELQVFLGMLASLVGLAGTRVLKKWKDNRFALPVFVLAQLQVFGLLLASLILASIHTFDPGLSSGWWSLLGLTWLIATLFFVLSDILNPYMPFVWIAVVALLPLPWFFLKTFDSSETIFAFGFWFWGVVLALASEGVLRLPVERFKRYHWALLTGSLPLFVIASLITTSGDRPVLKFVVFVLTALAYAVLHVLRPRWYVWGAALFSAVLAYLRFFALPFMQEFDIPLVYQLLFASCLLLSPELFARSPLSLTTTSRATTIAGGVLLALPALTFALADFDHPERGALTFFIYAVLLTLHALQGRREWLGYFAAASGSLAIVYALDALNLDLWLPMLTLLAVLFYALGFVLRRLPATKSWGNILINSGLALGILFSLTSLILSKEASGWYTLVVALLFAVELFTRPFTWLELAVEAFLSVALYEILKDFNLTHIGHFLFGASLIWLGGDLLFHHVMNEKRIFRPIVVMAGYLLVFLSTLTLLSGLEPGAAMIYFALYAVFFAVCAFLQNEARLGYLATAFLPLAVIKLSDLINFEKWIFPLILLAVSYYVAGFWLRRGQESPGWDHMLLYSGLGLGALTSFAAPLQRGLDASIPVAIAATLFAVEAYALRNAWWALPANLLYLLSYFMILLELNVDEPQFYSIGTALLGMLMHYLLTRAGSKTGAFIAGMLSQLVLLGTTYIQMVSTERLLFFFVLFVQSMLVLIYGLIQRSRSLVITPITFAVVGVMTVVYSALKGLGPVILIGSTGVVLLVAGIVAVLMRERITRLGEQLSDWSP